ncbi:MAG: glycoside hydrolase family 28 protein [Oscillospiraceae bacterium]|nr:glycoside hydrolase family 28 protein [Oscillospiraceae bacterium]
MEIKTQVTGARFAVIEADDGGTFDTLSDRDLLIDGRLFGKARSINYIDGLSPDTEYRVSITGEGGGEIVFTTAEEFVTLDVRKFGAHGDGVHDDTVYIQAAVMACPGKSRVLIPKGKYKITNIFMKSDVSLEIAEGAVLIADNDRYSHPIMPGMIESYDEKSEYNLGTWEGNPLKMFAGIISAVNAENVTIYGSGTIDGNASHDDWWYDEKVMRGAFRPRLMFFERCRGVSVYGLHLKDSPSWTVHPYFCEDVTLCALDITNPEVSPNTDGMDIESCRNVDISGVEFTLGDDCVAVKSGKIYMGTKYRTPAENVHIRHCLMKNGHGAVTVGSEISAGVKNLLVEKCDFINTDRGLRIKTRRGRGELSVIDDVIFRDIRMENVKTPFVANAFYFCDPDGRTDFVQDREPHPVDETTPCIKRLVFEDVECRDCHAAAAFFMGLPERYIEEIIMRRVNITFADDAKAFVPAMLCGVGEMCRAGIIAENVHRLILDDVSVKGAQGDVCITRNTDEVEGAVCR